MTNPELSPVSGKIEALTRRYEDGNRFAEVSTEVSNPGTLDADYASLLLRMLHESLPADATRKQMHIMFHDQDSQEEGRRIYFTSVYDRQEQAGHLLRYDLQEEGDEMTVLDASEVTREEIYDELDEFADGVLTFGLRAQTAIDISGFSETGTCDRLENARRTVEAWQPGVEVRKRGLGRKAAEFTGLTSDEIAHLREVLSEDS